jgi:hypothetical protein
MRRRRKPASARYVIAGGDHSRTMRYAVARRARERLAASANTGPSQASFAVAEVKERHPLDAQDCRSGALFTLAHGGGRALCPLG